MEAACCAAAAAQTAGSTPGGGGIKGGKPGTRPKGGIMGRGGALGGEGALAAGAGAGASFFTLAFEAGFLGMVVVRCRGCVDVRGGRSGARLDWNACSMGSVNMCLALAGRPARGRKKASNGRRTSWRCARRRRRGARGFWAAPI